MSDSINFRFLNILIWLYAVEKELSNSTVQPLIRQIVYVVENYSTHSFLPSILNDLDINEINIEFQPLIE